MRRMLRSKNGYAYGVTLIELLIVVTLIPLIIVSFIFVLDSIMRDAAESTAQAQLSSDVSFASDWLEMDVRSATNFESSIDTAYTDSYEPSGGWEYTGNGQDDRVLILSLPSTTLRDGTSNREITYQDDTFDCSSQMTLNPIMTYRAVYFVDNGTLFRRLLTDTTTATCNDQIQKQSCPAADMASWPSSCEARDEILAENVAVFSIDYYNSNDELPIDDAYTDASTLLTAKTVGITITAAKTIGSETVESTVNLRTARVN